MTTLTLKPKHILYFLTTIVVGLILAHIVAFISAYYLNLGDDYGNLIRLFYLDQEFNIPTLFASLEILLCALFLFVIAVAKKAQQERVYRYWLGLSAVFIFLSIDEMLALHELLIEPIRRLLNTSGFFYYAWIIPYGVLVLIGSIIYARFFFNLPRKTRLYVFIGGSLFLMGALGLEAVGGRYYDTYQDLDVTYGLITMLEEILELTGMTVLAYTFILYIAAHLPDLRLQIATSNKT